MSCVEQCLGVYKYIAVDGGGHTYLVTVIRGGASPDLRLLTLSIIVDILSAPKQNVCSVKSPVSDYFHDMTNSITGISEVGVQLSEWRVTLTCMSVSIFTGVGGRAVIVICLLVGALRERAAHATF